MFLAFGGPHLGLRGLWIGLTLSLVYAAALGLYICMRTDWLAEVRKVEARLVEGGEGKGAADGEV